MIGLPAVLATRKDWFNAFEYAKDHPENRAEFIARLEGLLRSKYCKVLKEGIQKPSEELTPEDFQDVPDPTSPFIRSGLGEEEILTMIAELKG